MKNAICAPMRARPRKPLRPRAKNALSLFLSPVSLFHSPHARATYTKFACKIRERAGSQTKSTGERERVWERERERAAGVSFAGRADACDDVTWWGRRGPLSLYYRGGIERKSALSISRYNDLNRSLPGLRTTLTNDRQWFIIYAVSFPWKPHTLLSFSTRDESTGGFFRCGKAEIVWFSALRIELFDADFDGASVNKIFWKSIARHMNGMFFIRRTAVRWFWSIINIASSCVRVYFFKSLVNFQVKGYSKFDKTSKMSQYIAYLLNVKIFTDNLF